LPQWKWLNGEPDRPVRSGVRHRDGRRCGGGPWKRGRYPGRLRCVGRPRPESARSAPGHCSMRVREFSGGWLRVGAYWRRLRGAAAPRPRADVGPLAADLHRTLGPRRAGKASVSTASRRGAAVAAVMRSETALGLRVRPRYRDFPLRRAMAVRAVPA